MKYQLVIQFSETSNNDLDALIQVEEKLDEKLIGADVDGHDIGNGQMNVFILTDKPICIFEQVKNILNTNINYLVTAKIAYRDLNEKNFICLWPEGLNHFEVT